MYICICNAVTDREIRGAASLGASLEDIKRDMGVASCCGKCEPDVRRIVRDCRQCAGRGGCMSAFAAGD